MVRWGRSTAVAIVVVGLVVGVPPAAGAADGGASSPPNDRLVRAQRVELEEVVAGDLRGATTDEDDEQLCFRGAIRTVWYEYVAPVNGVLRVHVDSAADLGVAILAGAKTSRLQPIECLDQNFDGETERIGARVERGARYAIAVIGMTSDLATSFTIVAKQHLGAPPTNDDFATAAPIGVERVAGTTVGGTRQTDEPEPDCAWEATATVWYRFEASTPGTRTFRLSSPSDQGFDLFEGESLQELTRIACADFEWAGDDENLRVRLEPGTYWIAVMPFLLGDEESFELEVIDNGLAACQWVYMVDVCAETGPLGSPAPKVGVS